MIGKTLGHYRITAKIGAGGMGEVYRAQDEHLNREVAVKVLPSGALSDEQTRKRFRREAEILSKLNHPHIATVHDFDTQDGVDFLVMEYVPGEALKEKLDDGPLPEKDVTRLGLQIAEALEAAHEKGVIHRDLKPGNIALNERGDAKVLDFGIAKLLRSEKEVAEAATVDTLTKTVGMAGTLPYMSPEQLRGEEVDARTDIYALGVVLYEMATGRRPFEATTANALVGDIQHKPPRPPQEVNTKVSPKLEDIILKALGKEPENRYQHADELAVDLRRLATPTAASTSRELPGGSARWITWGLGVGLGAVALLAVLLGLNLGGLRDNLLGNVAPEQIDSIVALPSKVFAAEEDSFLTDAIPGTLSIQLSQVEGLETKLPPSSVVVESMGGDLDKLADAYGVSAFVISTVTAQADRLILNVQLVEARSQRLLWSREYDGQRSNYIELVREAAEDLRAAVRPAGAPLIAATGVAASAEAELLYRRGRYYVIRYSHLRQPEDLDLAFSALENALKLDPKLADAAALIAGLFAIKADFQVSSQEENVREIENWARRALEIDPRSGTAWGMLLRAERFRPHANNRKVLEYGLRAVAFDAEHAVNHRGLGHALRDGGSLVLAEAAYREAYRLDPLSLHSGANLAAVLNATGRAQEALRVLDEVLRLEPDFVFGLHVKARCLINLGRAQEAAEIAKLLEARKPGSTGFLQFALALERGDRETALAGLPLGLKIITAPQTSQQIRNGVGRSLFISLARAGEAEAALDVATALAEAGTALHYDWVLESNLKNIEALLGDPRFRKLDALSRAQFEETISILVEARARGELPTYLETPLADLLVQMRSDPRFQSLLRRMNFPE